MSKSYRSDITGLRAIAVLAVAFFHIAHVFDPENRIFSGGFLGVDIFFVISGFLMTMIIIEGLENGKFSLWDFYKRRAKRICPALFVVVIATLSIAFIVFNLDFFRAKGLREGLASLGFISNFRFAKELDYFDGGDFTHLFLHTWSLSVEWQFYIFYPILLLIAKRYLYKNNLCCGGGVGLVIFIATIISFLVAITWTEFKPRQSYFLLPSRACELLTGSLAYFYPLKSIKDKIKGSFLRWFAFVTPQLSELSGLIIICVSFFIIDDKNGWPTFMMIIPMFGTYLCIASYNKRSLLNNQIFQKIGLWSYSIYLVHWPIIVIAASLGLSGYGFYWIVPIFALGIILHYTVERKRNYTKYFALAYFSIAGFIYVADANKLIYRLNPSSLDFFLLEANQGFKSENPILIGDKPEFIIHGDSHSLDLVKPIIERDYSFIINSVRGCYSLGNRVLQGKHTQSCELLYQKLKKLASDYPKIPIILQLNWPAYAKDYGTNNQHISTDEYANAIISDITQISKDLPNHKIYIIGRRQGNPLHDTGNFAKYSILSFKVKKLILTYSDTPKNIQYTTFSINEALKLAIENVNKKGIASDENSLAHMVYVDPDVYCHNNMCDLFINNNIPIYADSNHLTWAGAEKPVTQLLNIMGIARGKERTDFSLAPNIDFHSIQKELSYNEGDLK